jgi:glycosyltransferase involved in cell wall biosynthesis
MPFLSFIIPVYNRPQEVAELLDSLSQQTRKNFEVILVEDGSQVPCREAVTQWTNQLAVRYLSQTNQGPGPARNTGAREANGEWLVFLDSDCQLPPNYTEEVTSALKEAPFHCFGGPDRAHIDFNTTQKAIGHAMSSLLTTGGIRGGHQRMDTFYPRSFNLGVQRQVFQVLGGFSQMRFGEDLDFSMRLLEKGYSTHLLPGAWVYHKRRNTLTSFFKQVYNSGIARINLEQIHPGTLKAVHLLPALFALGYPAALLLSFLHPLFLIFVVLPPLAFFTDALTHTRELKTALMAVPASFTQLMGYGLGFLSAFVKRKILKRNEFEAFKKNFYK